MKLALLLDRQDICIVEVAKPEAGCVSITNYAQTEIAWSLAWAPDSNYLAYINTEGEIQVFSFLNHETYLIADTDNLLYLPIGSTLLWGR